MDYDSCLKLFSSFPASWCNANDLLECADAAHSRNFEKSIDIN